MDSWTLRKMFIKIYWLFCRVYRDQKNWLLN